MERFFGLIDRWKNREPQKLPLEMTPQAKVYLKKMMRRPNPTFAEFMFFGLGIGNTIDQILLANDKKYMTTGLTKTSTNSYRASIHQDDLVILFEKLAKTGRENQMMLIGHTHPSGEFELEGRIRKLSPDWSNLIPTMGSESEGGPTSAHDLKFAVDLQNRLTNIPRPYFGIASETPKGPKLRIYRTLDLTRLKKRRDIDRIAQITINL